jgi:glutathione S-transferase
VRAAQAEPLRLFVMGGGWGVPFRTSSPFPLKLEAWLRMTGIRYELVVENDPGKGPKKKSPWIVDVGTRIGDSELIIAYLKDRYCVDPDAGMTADERALALAWHRTFEEHYHQAFEHELFLGRGGNERLTEFVATLPALVRTLVRGRIASQLRRQLYARGLGRHDPATIVAMGKADLDAADAFLGDKAYFLGDVARTVDAAVFGFLGASIYVPGDNPLFRHAASLRRLVAYTERMRERFFPETLGLEAAS